MKTLRFILMQGIQGSGKTTRAEEIQKSLPGEIYLTCIDSYFTRNGKYEYREGRLPEHMQMQGMDVVVATLDGLERLHNNRVAGDQFTVLIDNPNILVSTIEPYHRFLRIQKAQMKNRNILFEFKLERVLSEHHLDAATSRSKSPHNPELRYVQRLLSAMLEGDENKRYDRYARGLA